MQRRYQAFSSQPPLVYPKWWELCQRQLDSAGTEQTHPKSDSVVVASAVAVAAVAVVAAVAASQRFLVAVASAASSSSAALGSAELELQE